MDEGVDDAEDAAPEEDKDTYVVEKILDDRINSETVSIIFIFFGCVLNPLPLSPRDSLNTKFNGRAIQKTTLIGFLSLTWCMFYFFL